ncbi:phytase [Flavobacteriaceae bacterium F08102]|nr:phytase [Flavobacteriaceae bacterium F08102]
MKKQSLLLLFGLILIVSCKTQLPEISPTVVTDKLPHDSDDAAIWINPSNPSKSIVFGTDKDEINGGVYAFNLDGKLIPEKSLNQIAYPNNVDVAYGFKLNDSTMTDILAFTEREKHRIRIYALPSMQPLDGGGIEVFSDETEVELKRPMGIAFYKNPSTGTISVILSRKKGPIKNYLYQYALDMDNGTIQATLMRKFGKFSGKKEIEAIAVDNTLGYVYYSDEGVGIRKYYADPANGNDELSLFGMGHFKRDIEGLAIATFEGDEGFIIASDQQDHTFSIFKRSDNSFVKKVNLGTLETDGCEVTTQNLGPKFPKGLFVSMNDEQNFFYHSLDSLQLH